MITRECGETGEEDSVFCQCWGHLPQVLDDCVAQSGLVDFMAEFISKQNPGVVKVKVKQATLTKSYKLEKTLEIIKYNH